MVKKSSKHIKKSGLFIAYFILLLTTFVLASPSVNIFNPVNSPNVTSEPSIIIEGNITVNDDLANISFGFDGVNNTVYDKSLKSKYDFNNLSSLGENQTRLVDILGNDNFTIYGDDNVTFSSGRFDNSITFNGKPGYVKLNSTIFENWSNEWSISVWAKTAKTSTLQYAIGSDNPTRIYIGIDASNNWFMRIGAGTAVNAASAVAGQWTNLIIVYNKSDALFYQDATYKGKVAATPANVINLGISGFNYTQDFFNGSIDDLYFYNRTLSTDEINSLQRTNLKRFNLANFSIHSNQSLNNTFSNSSTTKTYAYSLCSSNSSGSQTCDNNQINMEMKKVSLIVNYSQSIGNINNNFYGAYVYSSGYLTSSVDAYWLERYWSNSKMNYMRVVSTIYSTYSNTSIVSGVNYTGDLTNLTNLISFAKLSNNKVLITYENLPSWLADNSSGKCTSLNKCPINNYTKLGNIMLDEYNRIGCVASVCEMEILNEPYGATSFMGGLGYDHMQKALNYSALYLGVWEVINASNPDISIGGPSGFRNAPNMTNTFVTNVSATKRDFISIHPYGYSRTNVLDQYVDINNLYLNCTALSADCGSRIIISEWGIGNSALENLTYGWDEYEKSIYQSYSALLNNYPSNVSSTYMIWTRGAKYNPTFPEYPSIWDMVSSTSYDNKTYPPYNVTMYLATIHPSGSSIKNATQDSCIKWVYSTKGNMKSMSLVNTCSYSLNVTVNLTGSGATTFKDLNNHSRTFTASGATNLGIMDSYQEGGQDNILYLTEDLQKPTYDVDTIYSSLSGSNLKNYFNLTLDEEGAGCFYQLEGKTNQTMTKQGYVNNFVATNTSDLMLRPVTFDCNDTFNNRNTTKKYAYTLTGITNALLHNGTSNCSGTSSTIENNDGWQNITLVANERCYVLNKYELNESAAVTNAPIWFSSSTDTAKHISSNLTMMVNVSVTVDTTQDCDKITAISYTSDTGNYTKSWNGNDAQALCHSGKIDLGKLEIEHAASSGLVSISYINIYPYCESLNQSLGTFGSYFAFIILGIVVIIVLAFVQNYELDMKSLVLTGVIALTMGAIFLVMGIVFIESIC